MFGIKIMGLVVEAREMKTWSLERVDLFSERFIDVTDVKGSLDDLEKEAIQKGYALAYAKAANAFKKKIKSNYENDFVKALDKCIDFELLQLLDAAGENPTANDIKELEGNFSNLISLGFTDDFFYITFLKVLDMVISRMIEIA